MGVLQQRGEIYKRGKFRIVKGHGAILKHKAVSKTNNTENNSKVKG